MLLCVMPTAAVLATRPRAEVLRIEMHRPGRLNALNDDLCAGMHAALDEAESDRRVRLVVVTGAGRGFSAGLDRTGYGAAPGTADLGPVNRGMAFQRYCAGIIQRVHRLPKPVIAQVNGPAAGFGMALACACDIRIASPTALFTTAAIRIGVSGCELGLSWLLPRLVGAGRAHELQLTARRVDAQEALRIGLAAEVVSSDAIEARVSELTETLLTAAPLSLELTKQAMWLGLEMPTLEAAMELENRQQILSAQTEDASESSAAFAEGRPASFRYR